MTQEEKAKAYDEAIERAKAMIKVAANQDEAIGFANTIFPELKESEDEKIRKALIRYFTLSDEHAYNEACGVSYRDIVAWLEKQGQQKTDDKTEPKFKVGNWILIDNPCQIESIDNNGNYVVRYCDTEETHLLSRNFCDSHFHLWTIQDAKEGDVLVDEDANVIGIFEGIEGMCWHSKFYYSNITKEFYGIECGGSHLKEFAKPANKEQRDTLMEAMADEGYTFDLEKKELKKIEQKHAERSEEDESRITVICTYLQDYARLSGSESRTIRINEYCDWLKSLRPQPKLEWSEEDSDAIEQAIIALEDMFDKDHPLSCYSGYKLPFDKAAERLKSIKNRIFPQTEEG